MTETQQNPAATPMEPRADGSAASPSPVVDIIGGTAAAGGTEEEQEAAAALEDGDDEVFYEDEVAPRGAGGEGTSGTSGSTEGSARPCGNHADEEESGPLQNTDAAQHQECQSPPTAPASTPDPDPARASIPGPDPDPDPARASAPSLDPAAASTPDPDPDPASPDPATASTASPDPATASTASPDPATASTASPDPATASSPDPDPETASTPALATVSTDPDKASSDPDPASTPAPGEQREDVTSPPQERRASPGRGQATCRAEEVQGPEEESEEELDRDRDQDRAEARGSEEDFLCARGTQSLGRTAGHRKSFNHHVHSKYGTVSYRKIRRGNTRRKIEEFESMMMNI